jgi:hypothetical protein
MKKDAHSKRLQLWIQYLRGTGERKSGRLPEFPYPEFLGEPIRGLMPDWRSGFLADLGERNDSFLLKEPIAEPILRAFDEFGLNRSNPFAWRLLVFVFAEVHFGTHRSAAGAPTKWTDRKWCNLLSDFNQMQVRHPNASEAAICSHLTKDRELQQRYSKISPETIRRNLQYARNPERNRVLEINAELIAEEALRMSSDVAPAKHEQITQKAVKKALHEISTAWKRRAKIKT